MRNREAAAGSLAQSAGCRNQIEKVLLPQHRINTGSCDCSQYARSLGGILGDEKRDVRTLYKVSQPSFDEFLGLFGGEASHLGVPDERAIHVTIAGNAGLGGEFGHTVDIHLYQVPNPKLQGSISMTPSGRSHLGGRLPFALIIVGTSIAWRRCLFLGSTCPWRGLFLGCRTCP